MGSERDRSRSPCIDGRKRWSSATGRAYDRLSARVVTRDAARQRANAPAPERGRFRGTGSAGLGGGCGADVDAQVAVEDVFVDQLRGVAGEGDAAPAEYVGVVGDGQGPVDVLLDDEQGRPLVALGLLAAGAGVAAFARRDLQGA